MAPHSRCACRKTAGDASLHGPPAPGARSVPRDQLTSRPVSPVQPRVQDQHLAPFTPRPSRRCPPRTCSHLSPVTPRSMSTPGPIHTSSISSTSSVHRVSSIRASMEPGPRDTASACSKPPPRHTGAAPSAAAVAFVPSQSSLHSRLPFRCRTGIQFISVPRPRPIQGEIRAGRTPPSPP
eukprot:scaffold28747_cov130-Isochrysis_galbana.AAC.1